MHGIQQLDFEIVLSTFLLSKMTSTFIRALFVLFLVGCNPTIGVFKKVPVDHVLVDFFRMNQNVTLSCGAESDLMNIAWTKNGDQLEASNATLLITDLFHGDRGEYRCEACGDLECVKRTVKLDVTYRINDMFVNNKTVLFGSDTGLECVPRVLAEYKCNVSSVQDPPANLEDFKSLNNKLNSGFNMKLLNVSYDNAGWYTCVVTFIDKSQQDVTLAFKSAFVEVSEYVEEHDEPVPVLMIAAEIVGVLSLLAILTFLLYRQCRLKKKYYDRWVKVVSVTTLMNTESDTFQMPVVSIKKLRSIVQVNTSYESSSTMEYEFPIDENWEFPRNKLTLGEQLGEGAFGKVVMAQAEGLPQKDVTSTVAIKMLKDDHTDNDVKDLVCELEIMKIIGRHPNIVNLLGSCALGGPLYVIVEFAAHGNLKSFLPNNNLKPPQLINFANQIAHGMLHLSSMKMIHRDLAARNVLVTESFTMKIADFGLARDIHNQDYYRKTTVGKLPIRWMAPESLDKLFFDTKSDVWSYGVLLWEIMTLGRTPYTCINGWEHMFEYLKRGNRLEQPANCPKEIYDIMKECWQFEASERPTFELIAKSIGCFCMELNYCSG